MNSTRFLRKELFDRLTPMNARSIPEHKDTTSNMTLQMLQETHNRWSSIRAGLLLHIQLARLTHPTDHRQVRI